MYQRGFSACLLALVVGLSSVGSLAQLTAHLVGLKTPIGSGLKVSNAVAVDASGNVYIADTQNDRVLKETLSGGTYTQSTIGSGLVDPWGVAVDVNGVVYIASDGNTKFFIAKAKRGEPGSHWPVVSLTALVFLSLPFGLGARKRFRHTLCVMAMVALLGSVIGCTDTFYPLNSTAPGPYQIPLTATDSNQNSQTVMLVVVVPQQ
ncbi:MAG: hypothetical protein WBY53_20390 [Acidobacteriaceae bacterium]